MTAASRRAGDEAAAATNFAALLLGQRQCAREQRESLELRCTAMPTLQRADSADAHAGALGKGLL